MLTSSDINAEALRDHFSLPVLAEDLAKVQQAMGSDYVRIRRIAHPLSLDALLVAQVVIMDNAAAYGWPCDIREGEGVVAYLGLREINHRVRFCSVLDHLVNALKIWAKRLLR